MLNIKQKYRLNSNDRFGIKTVISITHKPFSIPDRSCFLAIRRNDICSFQIITGFWFFRLSFLIYPRKISEYLRTKSPSDANTRNMICFYNILNINDLCLKGISSLCEKAHFVMRKGLFQRLKWPISHPNMGFFALRNGQYRNTERTFPDYVMGYIKIRYYTKCPLFCMI